MRRRASSRQPPSSPAASQRVLAARSFLPNGSRSGRRSCGLVLEKVRRDSDAALVRLFAGVSSTSSIPPKSRIDRGSPPGASVKSGKETIPMPAMLAAVTARGTGISDGGDAVQRHDLLVGDGQVQLPLSSALAATGLRGGYNRLPGGRPFGQVVLLALRKAGFSVSPRSRGWSNPTASSGEGTTDILGKVSG